ncbi:MAG: MMPL family transporter [Clostridia bacterium]|nr:MMPL family transporter [Clostridia bacterium]
MESWAGAPPSDRAMRTFYRFIVYHPKLILVFFALLAALSAVCFPMVGVNYDMNDYLPEDSPSTVAIDVMSEEFDGGIPNARVMLRGVSIAEALRYKDMLAAVEGVTDVLWLDDSTDVSIPLSALDPDLVETYYKDGNALMTLTIEEENVVDTVDTVRAVIGEENAMSGAAVSTAVATTSTVTEIPLIAAFAVVFTFLVLLLTTQSWLEPVIVLGSIGVAVLINSGSNIIFGTISFVTNAAGAVLQLAVSLDYGVFLQHRFEDCRKEQPDIREALIDALCASTSSILSSGLTTVIGFIALCIMRFGIGSDLGLALAKGVAISLIVTFVFTPSLIMMTYRLNDRLRHRSFVPSFNRLGHLTLKMMIPLTVLFLLVVPPARVASNSNSYYFGSSKIFGLDTQLGSDTAQIEEAFGKQDTYVLLVPRGNFALEKTLSNALQELDEVTSIISYVDTAGAQIPVSYLEESERELLLSDRYSRMVLTVDADYEGEATSSLVQEIRSLAQLCYPDSWLLAGEGVSTYDLMDTITEDMGKVNAVSIGAVFLVLLLSMKSLLLPFLLVLSIEAAIWLNTACPFVTGTTVFYISYLIITSVQLGATVDYAILFTEHYTQCRKTMSKRDAIVDVIENCTVSVLSSGSVLTCVGYLLGGFSSHGILSQLGTFLGRGTLCSLAIVLFVLPGLLFLLDGPIRLTTLHAGFCPAKGPKEPHDALPEQAGKTGEAQGEEPPAPADATPPAHRRRRSDAAPPRPKPERRSPHHPEKGT